MQQQQQQTSYSYINTYNSNIPSYKPLKLTKPTTDVIYHHSETPTNINNPTTATPHKLNISSFNSLFPPQYISSSHNINSPSQPLKPKQIIPYILHNKRKQIITDAYVFNKKTSNINPPSFTLKPKNWKPPKNPYIFHTLLITHPISFEYIINNTNTSFKVKYYKLFIK